MKTRIAELKRYVRFTDEDARRLHAFAPTAGGHFRRIAQEFYERIREHEEAHAVFTGEAQIQRLQDSMVRWLERVFGGVYDDVYFRKTDQIGRVHVKVGLPQRYMFTAMALVRSSLTEVFDAAPGVESAALGDALSRLLDLELAVMLESYREDLVGRVERAAQQRAEADERRVVPTEEHYARVVELAALLVIGLDGEGRILLFNRAAERATGYARDEVAGKVFLELFAEDAVGRSAMLESAGEALVAFSLRTRPGRLLEVRWRIVRAPPTGSAGEVASVLVGDDVTEEKDALELQWREQRLASVGMLAAGLAHEIRNPLNGARLHVSFLERALRKDGAPDVLEAVHVVDDEIQRLARLVTDFLDFAHPRPPVSVPVDARALCTRAIQLASAGLDPERVRIEGDFPRNDLVFPGDAERLGQVLINLLRNAMDAVGDAGRIVVRARREPRHAIIEVIDDGPGFAAANAPVFEAFYTTKPNGTGLGLAIVHRIVTDHRGRVDVQRSGGETTFRLVLPLVVEEGEER